MQEREKRQAPLFIAAIMPTGRNVALLKPLLFIVVVVNDEFDSKDKSRKRQSRPILVAAARPPVSST